MESNDYENKDDAYQKVSINENENERFSERTKLKFHKEDIYNEYEAEQPKNYIKITEGVPTFGVPSVVSLPVELRQSLKLFLIAYETSSSAKSPWGDLTIGDIRLHLGIVQKRF